ncbi:MAG: MgtC/SapB family protein [Candidatus Scatovivens sp.]
MSTFINLINLESVLKLLLAFILSGIIGAQREIHNKPAGFKTHSLIGISAVLCMIAGQQLKNSLGADASRIPAQLISGIGFIGAGTILTDGFNVKGLTTASSLLGVACLGLIIGSGAYIIGILATILIYLLLAYSNKLFPDSLYHDQVEFLLDIKSTSKIMSRIEQIFAKHSLLIDKISTSQLDENNMKKVRYVCKYKSSLVFNKVLTEISSLEDVINIEMISNYELS